MLTRGLIALVRIVGAIFFGFVGLRTGQALAEADAGLTRLLYWIVPPVSLTIFGALAAPFILIRPVAKFQEWTQQIRPLVLLLGITGLIAGLLVSALLTPWLITLPGIGSALGPLVVSFVLGILGVATLVSREHEFAQIVNRFVPGFGEGAYSPNEIVVDTSSIIDGRLAEIAESGFIGGTLVISRFVLDELRHIADSPDAARRTRGRRGLEILAQLQKSENVNIRVAEDDFENGRDVDAKLLSLARKLHVPILTNDFNLNRVAELENIRVLNINQLANAVKAVVLPGEEMAVHVIQEGKETGQGVAFLEDGTMVVVEGGRRYLNEQLTVTVTRVLQTMAGRMIFAQPKGS
ncbi:MAG TPA: PIN domain-containing protein [Dehalococcoidia bacterium]|nr:PIN domain-containing protein [Dehalococcoidia bacterium]